MAGKIIITSSGYDPQLGKHVKDPYLGPTHRYDYVASRRQRKVARSRSPGAPSPHPPAPVRT